MIMLIVDQLGMYITHTHTHTHTHICILWCKTVSNHCKKW